MPHVAVQVPATTANLGPGFDALGAALSLYLSARTVDRAGGGAALVEATGEGAAEVPVDDTNLLWQAFERACAALGGDVPAGVGLRVHNDVPLARGLGSSSAAIVAGISLARGLLAAEVGDRAVAELATEIEGHPDNVVPAVMGGLTVSGRADDGTLVIRRVLPHARLRPFALIPATTQSTEEARGVLPDILARGDVAAQASRAAHVTGALLGAWPADVGMAGDLLHEPPRLEVMAPTGEVVAELRERGIHAWLSGAGPTAAGVVARRDQDAAAVVTAVGQAAGFAVKLLDWDLRGATVCPEQGCALSGAPTCWQCPRNAVP